MRDSDDKSLWQKCRLIFPHRTIDGGWTGPGQTWRRKRDGRWEYQQDQPTMDDLDAIDW